MPYPEGLKSSRRLIAQRRERVVWMTRWGMSAAEIARDLDVSVRTVQRMRQSARLDLPIGRPLPTWQITGREKRNKARNARRKRAKLALAG